MKKAISILLLIGVSFSSSAWNPDAKKSTSKLFLGVTMSPLIYKGQFNVHPELLYFPKPWLEVRSSIGYHFAKTGLSEMEQIDTKGPFAKIGIGINFFMPSNKELRNGRIRIGLEGGYTNIHNQNSYTFQGVQFQDRTKQLDYKRDWWMANAYASFLFQLRNDFYLDFTGRLKLTYPNDESDKLLNSNRFIPGQGFISDLADFNISFGKLIR